MYVAFGNLYRKNTQNCTCKPPVKRGAEEGGQVVLGALNPAHLRHAAQVAQPHVAPNHLRRRQVAGGC